MKGQKELSCCVSQRCFSALDKHPLSSPHARLAKKEKYLLRLRTFKFTQRISKQCKWFKDKDGKCRTTQTINRGQFDISVDY